jgi:hypothetical protein
VSHGFSKNSQQSVAHGLGRIVTKVEAEGLVRATIELEDHVCVDQIAWATPITAAFAQRRAKR